jgi:hypothetical protein
MLLQTLDISLRGTAAAWIIPIMGLTAEPLAECSFSRTQQRELCAQHAVGKRSQLNRLSTRIIVQDTHVDAAKPVARHILLQMTCRMQRQLGS